MALWMKNILWSSTLPGVVMRLTTGLWDEICFIKI